MTFSLVWVQGAGTEIRLSVTPAPGENVPVNLQTLFQVVSMLSRMVQTPTVPPVPSPDTRPPLTAVELETLLHNVRDYRLCLQEAMDLFAPGFRPGEENEAAQAEVLAQYANDEKIITWIQVVTRVLAGDRLVRET